jgi:hypothetical protein
VDGDRPEPIGTTATSGHDISRQPDGHPRLYSLAVDDLPDDLHSVFVDWPSGVGIDEPEVRYVSEMNGVLSTWQEIERIPHRIDGLFDRIEVVFRRTS